MFIRNINNSSMFFLFISLSLSLQHDFSTDEKTEVDKRFRDARNVSNVARMDAIRVRFIPISSNTVLVRCCCSMVRMVAEDLGVREESGTTGVDQGCQMEAIAEHRATLYG